MSQNKKLKSSERMAIANEIVKHLQKRYKASPPKTVRPVLETLLHACLIEDAPQVDADAALDRLLKTFHDFNEIRVSSVGEIESIIGPLHDAGWKAVRLREVLQYTFEKYYQYDLEQLRRKSTELAEKQLKAIKHITPFMLLYLQQHSLQQHTVPLDTKSRDSLIWLGLLEPKMTIEAAAEELKQVVRKADTTLFCHLVRYLATDSAFKGKFKLTAAQTNSDGIDAHEAKARLNTLFAGGTFKSEPVHKADKPLPAAKDAATHQSKVVKKPVAASTPSPRAAAKKPAVAQKPEAKVAKKVAMPVKAAAKSKK